MEMIIKFDENDIVTHNSDIVETILQLTNMKRDKLEQKESKEVTEQQKSEQQQQTYTLEYVRQTANTKSIAISDGKNKIVNLIAEKYGGKGIQGIKQCDYVAFLKDLEELE
ncbi:MAG: hypothetical protein HFE57_05980 [Firmicutes bacterium]|jgi:hypothetical protein|nr:hypothetical protein [Bacillota bacterium]